MTSTNRIKLNIVCLVAAALIFRPLTASADAGIPMLPIAYPIVLLFLLPVIAVEAIYLQIRLRAGWWRTVKAAAIVNAITLVLGYPLAWVVSFLIELLLVLVVVLMEKAGLRHVFGNRIYWLSILSPAWLGPADELSPILIAFVVLLVPAFLLSGYVEGRMLQHYDLLSSTDQQRTLPEQLLSDQESFSSEEKRRKSEVWRANLFSYLFLAAAGCLALYFQFRSFHSRR